MHHRPTAKVTASPLQPSDGMILEIGPRLEGHSGIFLVIQAHLSCRFLPAVDFPGLRRSGSWSQIINQAQDFPEQFPRHGNLGQLERDVPAMAHDLGADLDQLVPERSQGTVLDLLWRRQGHIGHAPAEVGKPKWRNKWR